MRRHPEIGADILGSGHFEDIRGWILAHHERQDGGGYPAGLAGEEIPLEARILAAADAYEAMTADRVYRPALGVEEARAELRRCAGSQFDSRVVGGVPRRSRAGGQGGRRAGFGGGLRPGPPVSSAESPGVRPALAAPSNSLR